MAIPGEGFISAVPDAEVVNRKLPVPYESTWREGGDGSAMTSAAMMPHTERAVEAAEADVELGIAGNGDRQLVATLRRLNAYGAVLLDSFEGNVTVELVGPEDFYFGRAGGADILRHGHSFLDDGQPVAMELTPRAVAPAGVGGEVLFRNLYLTLSFGTGFKIVVTPVVDGERIDAEATTVEAGSSTDTTEVFEVPLTQAQNPGGGTASRQGLRGTWFTFELSGEDVLRLGGDLTLENVELEHEILRESHPGRSFAVEPLTEVSLDSPGQFYLGRSGGADLLRADDGADDAGSPVAVRAQTNELAPAGASGECVFANIYLTLTRANTTDLELEVRPVLDRVVLAPISVTLPAVSGPVTEVREIPLTKLASGSRHLLRGTWFGFRIDTVGALPAERVVLEGADLEYEVVRESEEAADAG